MSDYRSDYMHNFFERGALALALALSLSVDSLRKGLQKGVLWLSNFATQAWPSHARALAATTRTQSLACLPRGRPRGAGMRRGAHPSYLSARTALSDILPSDRAICTGPVML